MKYKHLSKLESPSDLRRLSMKELDELGEEIRQEITRVVYKTGGHFASNLGTVELAIALHYCYDFREGKVLWDVGHQAYPHKLLTGRLDRFESLRQDNGISGFPNATESPYDPFTTGHAGTSISTGLGLKCGLDLLGEDKPVVVVIGDGSMTAGMAIEGVNHCGVQDKNILIIINDNSMSIAETVGGISKYLTRIRTAHIVEDLRNEVYQVLDKIPGVGHKLQNALEHIQLAIRKSMVPGFLFEELGMTYLGPVDGHNTPELIKLFGDLQQKKGPIILHVITEKGKGHAQAVEDPIQYHSPTPTAAKPAPDAAPKPKGKSYTNAFVDSLIQIAQDDPRVVGITAAMPGGTGLTQFKKAFPDRYYDVGIAEQHAVGFAAGLRRAGARPVAAIYSTFLQRAFDQVFHEVTIQELGVVLAMDRAGVVGADGVTHHGVFDIAYLRPFPGITLMAPVDEREMMQMLALGIELETPSGLRYPRGNCPDVSSLYDFADVECGKSLYTRHGQDGAILAIGSMVVPATLAADELAKEGLNLSVVNARFIKPLDGDTLLNLIATHPFVLTIEEHMRAGGFGSAVLELAADELADTRKIHCLALPDQLIQHGDPAILLKRAGLSQDKILETVRRLAKTYRPSHRAHGDTLQRDIGRLKDVAKQILPNNP